MREILFFFFFRCYFEAEGIVEAHLERRFHVRCTRTTFDSKWYRFLFDPGLDPFSIGNYVGFR